jgi:hypothetical protein
MHTAIPEQTRRGGTASQTFPEVKINKNINKTKPHLGRLLAPGSINYDELLNYLGSSPFSLKKARQSALRTDKFIN